MKKQIVKLKQPCLKCVDLVVSELSALAHKCTEKVKGMMRWEEGGDWKVDLGVKGDWMWIG